jgi:diketogulonate reductase-like aldo/keto reductase
MTQVCTLIKLNNGITIPQVGLGVYDPQFCNETYQSVLSALECGYRHIDTASIYRNEDQVGRAVRDSGIPREQIFITSKVWDTDQGFEKTIAAYNKSLKVMGLEYLDLYLVHWPVRATRRETYRALEKLYRDGRVRAIGVSNYLTPHLSELLSYAEIIPAINQFEITPYLYDQETVALCQSNGICVESYSPLVRGRTLGGERLISLAEKYSRSPSQILLRWAVDHGFVTIPKSSDAARIRSNFSLFDFSLSSEDLAFMDTFNDGIRVAPDPMTYL